MPDENKPSKKLPLKFSNALGLTQFMRQAREEGPVSYLPMSDFLSTYNQLDFGARATTREGLSAYIKALFLYSQEMEPHVRGLHDLVRQVGGDGMLIAAMRQGVSTFLREDSVNNRRHPGHLTKTFNFLWLMAGECPQLAQVTPQRIVPSVRKIFQAAAGSKDTFIELFVADRLAQRTVSGAAAATIKKQP